ncbi:Thiopurine S-methyltransferase [hydrothermal vent metagenome]|uniref:thiopurine S-methyltransferase n=1 Tax=hydrothermal vent metagenome TaxID=652676 RepID=A0A3B1C2Q5_9ZZZZ
MDTEFWKQRWQNNETGFHLDEVNPFLPRFWSHLHISENSRVFVPLCGKSLDLRWLREQGHEVWGVELSPLALQQFFSEQGLKPEIHRSGVFEIWEADGIRLFCGDFFELTPELLGSPSVVYDRASMIALPPAMRKDYARHLQVLAPASAPRLLVTLDYEQMQMAGPPFAVSEAEVVALYGSVFQIEKIFAEDILSENERFRLKGLTRLEESVYLLNPAG